MHPATEPSDEFPVYRTKAKCKTCGKEGKCNSFKQYPEGTVLTVDCGACVEEYEARVDKMHRIPMERVKHRATEKRLADMAKKRGAPKHWANDD